MSQPLDPATVTAVLLGGAWQEVRRGSFRVGALRVGSGSSGEAIRNDVWFTAELESGERFSGPFLSIDAVRH